MTPEGMEAILSQSFCAVMGFKPPPEKPRSWGNEIHMRQTIRIRRGLCHDLRKCGHTWREIAAMLGYGSPQHARIDWLRK